MPGLGFGLGFGLALAGSSYAERTPEAPANVLPPTILGTARVGEILTAAVGSWTGYPAPSYSYQWNRDGSPIVGAQAATYELGAADYGAVITVTVTATNSEGSASETSAATAEVAGIAPANTVAPSISGTAQVGATLTVNAGTWTGVPAPSYSYQWMRDSEPIGGANAATYTLVSEDEGAMISCRVTATNGEGSAYVDTEEVGPVAVTVAPPSNISKPTISGTAKVGETLTASTGVWAGNPAPTYAYQWNRDGDPIPGAENSTYTLVASDFGAVITVTVTATNSAGEAKETSDGTDPVAGIAPANIAPPTISGVAAVGQTLTASPGSWSGVPTPSHSYQWRRNGVAIGGATTSTYQLVAEDYGAVITVTVTATNSEGSSSETSAGTSAVAGLAPVNTVAPVISGTPKVGETLSVTTGTWTGVPTPSISYQWTRDGSDISGATGSTYTLIGDDEDAMIGCRVTATNAEGSDSADADAVGPVEAAGPARRYPTLIATPTSQPAVISQPQPAFKTPVQFGDLDTVVVRITDASMAHHYSTWQAFNADQSMVLLWGSGGTILNTSDWSTVRTGFDPGFVACFWDPVDPDIIWGHDGFGGGNGIYRYSVSANNSTRYPVPPASGGAYNGISIGGGEGSISADGKYLVLIGTKSGSDDRFVIVWDAESNEVEGTLTLSGWGSDLDNAMISPSGDWIVLASLRSGERGHRIYDRATLTFQRAYTGGSGTNGNNGFHGHMDIGYRTNGDEVMVRQRNDGGMVTVRLSDGNERLEIPGSSFSWGNHISCRNIHRPGYAYVSMSYQSDQTTKPLFREVFSVKLDGSGQIERWGQAMFPNNGNYNLQAKATASPYGDMVIMTSGWGTTTPREYVMYVPEAMPSPEPDEPEWLAFFDLTDISNMSQNEGGTTPVTAAGQRIGRVVDPVRGRYISSTDGDGTRFLLVSDPTFSLTGVVTRANPYQWLDDYGDGGWIDKKMNGRTPWWFCCVAHLLTTAETDHMRLITKQHTSNPDLFQDVSVRSWGGNILLIYDRDGVNQVTTNASAVTSGPVVLSAGYDGNNMTVRVNLGTKASLANSTSLPDSSVYDSAWFGDNRDQANWYALGFMDHYPSSEEEEAAIRQAGALAGLSL